MTHSQQKANASVPRGRTGRRVVYVDLDQELDEETEEIDLDFWLPSKGGLDVICRASCNNLSDAACDPPGAEHHSMCAPQENGPLNTSLCSAEAVNDFTRHWPPSEPYAFASPSGSDVKPRNPKRGQYKERHSYAKALLRSDRELEKLTRKIRTELQHSEMVQLALEAERAANAGLLTFSAKPSTFGSAEYPTDYRPNRTRLRSRNFSEGHVPFMASQIPANQEFRRFDLRNISEVIPQWKDLHSHMRMHMFRNGVDKGCFFFCEEKRRVSTETAIAATSLELSTCSIARHPLHFLEMFADTTMSRIKKRSILSRKVSPREDENDSLSKEGPNSESSRERCTKPLSPYLSSTTVQQPVTHADSDFLDPLSMLHDGESSGEEPTMLLSSICVENARYQCTKEVDGSSSGRLLREECLERTRMKEGMSDDVMVLHEHGKRLDRSFYQMSEKSHNSLSVDPMTRTPPRDCSSRSRNSTFDTPAGLRDIRLLHDFPRYREDFVSPMTSRVQLEPTSIIESGFLDGDGAVDGKLPSPYRKSALERSLPLTIPPIPGRSNDRLVGQNWDSEGSPRKDPSQVDLRVIQSQVDTEQNAFVRNFPSRDGGFFEEKKESDQFFSSTEQIEKLYKMESPSCQQTIHVGPVEVLQEHDIRDPISCDLESGDEGSSTSTPSHSVDGETRSPLLPTLGAGVVEQTISLTSRATNLETRHTQTPTFFQKHGLCQSFSPRADDIQVAVQAMVTGLSPSSPSRRRQPHLLCEQNDDFVTTYFYSSRRGRNNLHVRGRSCVDPCQDNNLGVDLVCGDIYHIFSGKSGNRNFMQEMHPRNRGQSLDSQVPRKSYYASWLGAVESLFSQCGSSSEIESGRSSSVFDQFDPPYFKKPPVQKMAGT